jgi:nitroreductase
MEVTEAIDSRRSVRGYLDKPVPQDVLQRVLELAQRAPSWANTQPWEVFVLQGAAAAELRAAYAQAHEEGVKPQTDLAPAVPEGGWTAYCQAGVDDLGLAQKRDCGEALRSFGRANRDFFGAPVLIYPCMDKALGQWSLYDVGAYAQTLMLAARQFGLDTIAAYTMTLYPDLIRRVAKVPDNLEVTIGIALGYADDANGLNQLRSPRRLLGQAVHFVD